MVKIILIKSIFEKSFRVNFDSACREAVFTYERTIKLSQGEGCLGYPRP